MNFIYDSHLCSLERAVPHAQTAGPPEEVIGRKPNVSNPPEKCSRRSNALTKKKGHVLNLIFLNRILKVFFFIATKTMVNPRILFATPTTGSYKSAKSLWELIIATERTSKWQFGCNESGEVMCCAPAG